MYKIAAKVVSRGGMRAPPPQREAPDPVFGRLRAERPYFIDLFAKLRKSLATADDRDLAHAAKRLHEFQEMVAVAQATRGCPQLYKEASKDAANIEWALRAISKARADLKAAQEEQRRRKRAKARRARRAQRVSSEPTERNVPTPRRTEAH